MSIDYKKLKSDLRKASLVAHNAADSVQDIGSCNLDFVIIPIGSDKPIKRRSKKLDSVFEEFGGERRDGTWIKGYGLNYACGQAAKNTRACEAAADVLKDWGAYVFYLVD